MLTLFDTRAGNLDVRRILDARALDGEVLRILPHVEEDARHRVQRTGRRVAWIEDEVALLEDLDPAHGGIAAVAEAGGDGTADAGEQRQEVHSPKGGRPAQEADAGHGAVDDGRRPGTVW